MASEEFSREEVLEVYPAVSRIMAESLGCDVEQVTLEASLIDDLEGESIDLLDLIFRLEREFKVPIPRGKIVEDARGDLPEEEFEQDGVVTEIGMERLRAYLSEVPADKFPEPMKVADIPKLFTTETFCRLVLRAQRRAKVESAAE